MIFSSASPTSVREAFSYRLPTDLDEAPRFPCDEVLPMIRKPTSMPSAACCAAACATRVPDRRGHDAALDPLCPPVCEGRIFLPGPCNTFQSYSQQRSIALSSASKAARAASPWSDRGLSRSRNGRCARTIGWGPPVLASGRHGFDTGAMRSRLEADLERFAAEVLDALGGAPHLSGAVRCLVRFHYTPARSAAPR